MPAENEKMIEGGHFIMETNRAGDEEGIACPSCDKELMPHLDIKLKSVEFLADFLKKREGVSFERTQYFLTTARRCPSCYISIQLQLEVVIKGAQVIEDVFKPGVGSQQETGRRMSREYHVNQLRESGALQAFEQALSIASQGQMPNNTESSLLDFLEGAEKLESVPRFVLDEFKREFPSHFITFWRHHGVVGVRAGSGIKWFVPIYYIKGRYAKSAGANGFRPGSEARPEQIQEWVKTRNGYVVGHGAMFEELKGRSAGDFSKASGI